jgi:Fur family peroxide stress response transcriptional regulator
MANRSQHIQQRVDRLGEGLKQAGIRLTYQRLEICREIATADSHPNAQTLYMGVRKRIPTISLDTVYRTLWTLRDLGLMDTVGIPRERIHFDADTTPHHHFICARCGEAHDFYSDDFDRLAIPEEVAAYGTVEKTQVEMSGVCVKCSNTSDPHNNEHNQRSK